MDNGVFGCELYVEVWMICLRNIYNTNINLNPWNLIHYLGAAELDIRDAVKNEEDAQQSLHKLLDCVDLRIGIIKIYQVENLP